MTKMNPSLFFHHKEKLRQDNLMRSRTKLWEKTKAIKVKMMFWKYIWVLSLMVLLTQILDRIKGHKYTLFNVFRGQCKLLLIRKNHISNMTQWKISLLEKTMLKWLLNIYPGRKTVEPYSLLCTLLDSEESYYLEISAHRRTG